jgi:hypothetical protein
MPTRRVTLTTHTLDEYSWFVLSKALSGDASKATNPWNEALVIYMVRNSVSVGFVSSPSGEGTRGHDLQPRTPPLPQILLSAPAMLSALFAAMVVCVHDQYERPEGKLIASTLTLTTSNGCNENVMISYGPLLF